MDTPKTLILTCKVTGKVVKYTNAAIIRKKCEEAGSVEAFVNNFVSKRAVKQSSGTVAAQVIKTPVVKQLCEEGVALGELTTEEYKAKYNEKVYTFGKGPNCTVISPIPVTPVFVATVPTKVQGKSWHGENISETVQA